MYKNIKILDKQVFKEHKYKTQDFLDVAKQAGSLIPLGFAEMKNMSYHTPIIINKLDDGEFVAFTSINERVNIFHQNGVYIPAFIRTYPFLNVVVKNKGQNDQNVIGIDNGDSISKDSGENIFEEDGELSQDTSKKVEIVRELTRQREVSKNIILELKKHNLLKKQEFKIVLDGTEKVVLEEFYVVDRTKLVELDDATLALWAKNGWIHLIDTHLESLVNFEKVVKSVGVE